MSQSGEVKVSITKVKKEAQSQGEGERVMREGVVQTPKWAESPTLFAVCLSKFRVFKNWNCVELENYACACGKR